MGGVEFYPRGAISPFGMVCAHHIAAVYSCSIQLYSTAAVDLVPKKIISTPAWNCGSELHGWRMHRNAFLAADDNAAAPRVQRRRHGG